MPTNFGVPSALDIAVHLGRESRWAGALNKWWTVLHHVHALMSMAALLTRDGGPAEPAVRAHILLHDAHEAILRDVPTTWKTDQQREQEARLDDRIYGSYLGHMPEDRVVRYVKAMDLIMLLAEGQIMGPPGCLHNAGLERTHDEAGLGLAVQAVMDTNELYPHPNDSVWSTSPLVKWYLVELRKVCRQERWEAYCESPAKP